MTERELIKGCVREDRDCQLEVFRLYGGKMLAVCVRYARHQMEAEDILQDAFIKIYDNMHKFKFKGSFDWHHHSKEDEFFYVVKGEFNMEFRDRIETIKSGEFIIVPKTIEHRPVAESEVEVMLIEPETTRNTGNLKTNKTITEIQRV